MVNVNGEPKEIAGKTIAEYLLTTNYDKKRIETELNGDIVPELKARAKELGII